MRGGLHCGFDANTILQKFYIKPMLDENLLMYGDLVCRGEDILVHTLTKHFVGSIKKPISTLHFTNIVIIAMTFLATQIGDLSYFG